MSKIVKMHWTRCVTTGVGRAGGARGEGPDVSLDLTQEQSKWWGWLETIDAEGVNLSKWEEDFVLSIRERFDEGRFNLSEKQAEILERIYTDRTP